MKTVEGEKITKIREGYGTVRQILVEGERLYRDVRRDNVVFEIPADEKAWDHCGPRMRAHVDLVNSDG